MTMIENARLKRSQISNCLIDNVFGKLPETERYTEAGAGGDIVGCLVDELHQYGGEVCHQDNTTLKIIPVPLILVIFPDNRVQLLIS